MQNGKPLPPQIWPEWLEEKRLDDAMVASAYESSPPSWRAALKTGLALARMHFGHSDEETDCLHQQPHAGFWKRLKNGPVSWAIVAFTPEYAAAARLLAACVAAQLADVPAVAAVCVGGRPAREALLALDLCGIEDIFILDEKDMCSLCRELAPIEGRLVLLHTGELDAVATQAMHMGIRLFEERQAPGLYLRDPESFDRKIIFLAHAIEPENCVSPPGPPHLSAMFCTMTEDNGNDCDTHQGFLKLAPGCEGFWLHPGLAPDFFKSQRLCFGMLQKN